MKPWEEVRDALASRGFKPARNRSRDTYRGTLKTGKILVDAEVSVRDFDFVELPKISLFNLDALPKPITGHLSEGGTLCYADPDTFLLDRFQPGPSVLLALKQAEETLAVLLHGNPVQEILAELPAYWGGHPVAFIDDPFSLTQVVLGSLDLHDGRHLQLAAKSEARLKDWGSALSGKLKVGKSYAVIQCAGDVLIPPRAEPNLKEALEWAQGLAGPAVDVYALAGQSKESNPGLFLIGRNAILGFCAAEGLIASGKRKGTIRAHVYAQIVLKQADRHAIERLRGVRADASELAGRNLGGDAPLANMRIAQIGCGTIGSYLARLLVQSGAGLNHDFLIIDHDIMSPDNVGRHALGARYIGCNKAAAMRRALKEDFPDVTVEILQKDARSAFSRLRGFDIVIDATGDNHLSNALNAHAIAARQKDDFPPVLYAMIFGNGVAVQTFLDKATPDAACFRCLKPIHHNDWRYSPLKPGVETEMTVRPCGYGTFAPFSVEASVQASGLALRQILDFASGNQNATLRTRVLDKKYGRSHNDKSVPKSDKCPACSSN